MGDRVKSIHWFGGVIAVVCSWIVIAMLAGRGPAPMVGTYIAPANGWLTPYDADLTAQGNHTFATDTTYTVGLTTWRKINSAGDSTAPSLAVLTGLTVIPGSSTDINGSTVDAPMMGPQFSSFIPGFVGTMPVRIWARAATIGVAANYDDLLVGAYAFHIGVNPPNLLVAKAGYSPGGVGVGVIVDALSGSTTNYDSALLYDDVFVIVLPQGIFGVSASSFSGKWAGGWPAPQSLRARGFVVQSGGGSFATTDAGLFDSTQAYVALGAQRAGSGTPLAPVYDHLRVDYQN